MKDTAVELEEEMLRRTTLQSGAGSDNQRSHSNDKSGGNTGGGVQLLSPTLADSFRAKAAAPTPELPRRSEYFGWSCSPTPTPSRACVHAATCQTQQLSDNQSGHDEASGNGKSAAGGDRSHKAFDFDGFTLASVCDRQDERERLTSSLRVSSQQPRKRHPKSSNSNAQSAARFRPERSMPVLGSFDDEDPALFAPATFDAQYQQFQLQQQQLHYHRSNNHKQQATRKRSGSGHSSSISSSTGSSDVAPPDHRAFAASSTAIFAATIANTDVEAAPSTSSAASGRHRATAVLVSGWLEKRKGLVLKRWRAYYCLFKEDDSLCLYASEDTVNGRLEHRFTVLRVLLTDKNDSFHVIAVDTEGAARREEFRASVSVEWQRWFLVFRRFFDEDSLHEALLRKPELLLLDSPARPSPSTLSDVSPKSSGSNDWYRHHHVNDRGSRAAGNRFDNDQEADAGREDRPSEGGSLHDRCSNDSYNSGGAADSERVAPTGRRSNKPLPSRASVSWSRVEPLPVGHKSTHSDNSKHKPRSLSTADGLGWQKTSTRESLDGSADELRSTMSLYSVSSGRSTHQSTSEVCGAPRRSAMPSVGWTGDLELKRCVTASGKKRLDAQSGDDREEHHASLLERQSASTRSSGPNSNSAIGWNWY